ncbi:MAG: zinc metalloprotease HtpX [Pseudomonadota bacterium]
MNYAKTMLLLAALTAFFMVVGYLIAGGIGSFLALIVAMGLNAYAWWNSDKMALRMHNARAVTRQSHPDLYQMLDEQTARAGLPMPAVYVIDEDQPNAFATGRDPSNAAVAATTGLLRMLSKEEVAGVMAHELAHIQNRDTLIMTVAATIAGAISFLAQYGLIFSYGRHRNAVTGILAILAVFLAPLAAMLIQMLISRTREYAADRRGAEICGNPLWLASALQRLQSGVRGRDMMSAEEHPATAHMFIVNPLSGKGTDNLFSTHPNMDNRVAALTEMAQEMGIASRASAPAAPISAANSTAKRSSVPLIRRRK